MWIFELKTPILVTLLLTIISFNYSQGYILICEFGNEEWINLGIVFQCKVQGMDITSRNSITEVIGESFRPLREVKALDVQDQRCQFVPSDVQTFFPNVEGLQVANSELKELQSDDMQQFPNLKQLFMSENELQSLENDVFEHCPNIEYVNLGHNNIMHMGTDIFAPLKNLQYCNIAGNSCIDTKMESPNAIQQFSKAVEMQCPPTPEMLKREKERKIPESLRTMAPPTTTTIAPEINELKEELMKLKNKIAEHDQQIDEIKSKDENSTAPSANSPPQTNQDQNIPEPKIEPPYNSPTNNLPELNRPKHSSANVSPMGYNLMDLVNLPVPNYQPYTSDPNPNSPQSPNIQNLPPENRPLIPGSANLYNPSYFQNIPSQLNIPVPCGPYSCPVPPNLSTPSQNPNFPQTSDPSNPNAFPPNINPSQSPYPYNPYPIVKIPPFPVYPSPPNSNDPEGTKPNPQNVSPQMNDPQSPSTSSPDNRPQNVPAQLPEKKQTPSHQKNISPQDKNDPHYTETQTPPTSTSNDEPQPEIDNPENTNPKPNECGTYGCPLSQKQPESPGLSNSAPPHEPLADDQKQQDSPELPPLPYRNLDVESSYNDPQYPPQMNSMSNPEPQTSNPSMYQTPSPSEEEVHIENDPQNDPGSSPKLNDKTNQQPPKSNPSTFPSQSSPIPSSSPPVSSTPTPSQPTTPSQQTNQTPSLKDDELSADPDDKSPKHPQNLPQNMEKPKECNAYGCSLSVTPPDPTKPPQMNDIQNTEQPPSPPLTNQAPPPSEGEMPHQPQISKMPDTENPQNSQPPNECDSYGCPSNTDEPSTNENSRKSPPTRKPSLINPKKSQEPQKPHSSMKKPTPPPNRIDIEDLSEDAPSYSTEDPTFIGNDSTESKELEDDTTINPELEEKIEELVMENEKKDNEILKLLKKIQDLEAKNKKQEKEIKALKL